MDIGDDLMAARGYVNAAVTHLDMIRRTHSGNEGALISELSKLEDGAARLHARGIQRSVADVIQSVKAGVSEELIAHRIHGLELLISQYTAGLDEIAPQAIRAQKAALAEGIESLRETLKPLIKFVDTPAQAKALKSLMAYNGMPRTAEIEGASLESLMPTITDLILSAARRSGKSVSVSYDVNDVIISNTLALDLQNFLIELGERLVAESIEMSGLREVAGLPANGVIHVTATDRAGILRLDVDIVGRVVDEADLALTSLVPLMQRGASFSIRDEGKGQLRARLSGLKIQASQDEIYRRVEVAQ